MVSVSQVHTERPVHMINMNHCEFYLFIIDWSDKVDLRNGQSSSKFEFKKNI